ncbi:hypothetical protein [Acidovorax sp. SUPP2539]|uniref:hypothetical protein n=1 Tax=Acidovorax sp. SUPP2539 TaxID=2920878 RepID=UPI0023DE5D6D|nr:hypothetical protein [Acidovorax sp. SUPP2539]GKS91235.1 hypothetical protein AVTE2539_17740 [Acidovorax sp. SUPP2539]
MTITRSPLQVPTTADLRLQPVDADVLVLTVCDTVLGDDKGGLYRWDPTSTAAEDTAFLNVVASSYTATGRWLRFAQRVRQLPQGVLTNLWGVKTLIASGVVSSSSDCAFNLTLDNTATGEAIFTEVWDNRAYSKGTASAPAGAVMSYPKALTSNLKTVTHGFYKANIVTITLSLVYSPFMAADTGSAVGLTITGK